MTDRETAGEQVITAVGKETRENVFRLGYWRVNEDRNYPVGMEGMGVLIESAFISNRGSVTMLRGHWPMMMMMMRESVSDDGYWTTRGYAKLTSP